MFTTFNLNLWLKPAHLLRGTCQNNNPIANARINCSCHLMSRVVKKSFLFSVPPKVVPVPPDGQFVVRKGSTITLTCQVSGNPRPKITWQRSVRLFYKFLGWRSAKCLNPSGKNSQVLSGWALCIATKTNSISISCVLRLKLGCGILSYDIVRHPAPL